MCLTLAITQTGTGDNIANYIIMFWERRKKEGLRDSVTTQFYILYTSIGTYRVRLL